jgi:hypothetical protein
LDRPGNEDIRWELFYDYQTNIALCPAFQEFFRTYQPPTLIVWGRNDSVFAPEGALAYGRDLEDIETTCSIPAILRWRSTGRRLPAI